MEVISECAAAVRALERLPFFTGRKPPNENAWTGNPDPTSAVRTADGPGRTVYSMLFSMHARSSLYPGSETAGIPASVIMAMFMPSVAFWMSSGTFFVSLCSWMAMSGLSISKCCRSGLEWRVSSQVMRSTSLSVWMALRVMSSRFPMGVGTK